MFLTSTRNQKVSGVRGTNVIFVVKIGLTIKMAITTANKGAVSMLALIVLKKISFLLDV